MEDKAKIDLIRYLNVIQRAARLAKEILLDNDFDDDFLDTLTAQSVPQPKRVAKSEPEVQSAPEPTVSIEEVNAWREARKKHIQSLMDIDCWPEAVGPHLIAEASEDDQRKRARAVLNMLITRDIKGKNFIDFGCGDGWIVQEALEMGVANATGYDIKLHHKWASFHKGEYTHIFNEVKKGFYDVVFMYDVLDHCKDPELVMNQVKSLLKKDGIVYIRCHPWTSKHATHLFKKGINKAYFHLFLKHEEIADLIGEEPMFTRAEKNPLEAYNWWFKDFHVTKKAVSEDLSPFFTVQSFKDLLGAEQELPPPEVDQLLERMKVQFYDFALQPK